MKTTILEGDVILVNKLSYMIRSPRTIPFTTISIPYFEFGGFGTLERGDVVVFDPPITTTAAQQRYVKRCVAIAGDTVQLYDGRFLVNGIELPPSPYDPLFDMLDGDTSVGRRIPVSNLRAHPIFRTQQPIMLPHEGYEISIDSSNITQWESLIQAEGVSVEFRNSIVFLAGLPATRYTFRHDYFLALGDNSGDSYDSRFFGPVPYDNLIGQAWFIYWSRSPEGEMRWGRMGMCVD